MAEKTKAPETVDKPKGGRKILLFAVIGLVVLGGGGAAAAYFLGLFGGKAQMVAAEDAPVPEGAADEHGSSEAMADDTGHGGEAGEGQQGVKQPPVPGVIFVDLPDVLVNLNSDTKRMRFLKLRVAVEVSTQVVAETVQQLTPRIIDSFQLYLRGLTVDDLAGPSALHHLKQEMLARINLALDPSRIDDVLFKEMLVQ